jgi:hypothetical protein
MTKHRITAEQLKRPRKRFHSAAATDKQKGEKKRKESKE